MPPDYRRSTWGAKSRRQRGRPAVESSGRLLELVLAVSQLKIQPGLFKVIQIPKDRSTRSPRRPDHLIDRSSPSEHRHQLLVTAAHGPCALHRFDHGLGRPLLPRVLAEATFLQGEFQCPYHGLGLEKTCSLHSHFSHDNSVVPVVTSICTAMTSYMVLAAIPMPGMTANPAHGRPIQCLRLKSAGGHGNSIPRRRVARNQRYPIYKKVVMRSRPGHPWHSTIVLVVGRTPLFQRRDLPQPYLVPPH